ncbi:DUF6665 family protein [Chelativorans sp. Marseille-P2723]|uniref:DUF6665 family protein n=1 Tax=Chelativorans sp. Marseille-P2723 TaxID=2709133 RepID=UPI00156F2A89|nr:DUF6665 family protein [Chelativorans sp. Marseille-P2723]
MLHHPASPGAARRLKTGLNVLDHELAQEIATSLGEAGRRAQESLRRLATVAEPDSQGTEGERARLLHEAADAVYAYFIQRELCGLRRHDEVIKQLAIPRSVLVRLGAR